MKKLTSKDIARITAGTELYDTVSGKYVKVTRVIGDYIELGLIIETPETIKKNYRVAR